MRTINKVLGIKTGVNCSAYLRGLKFGRIKVLSFSHKQKAGNTYHTYWNCICDCGKEVSLRGSWLTTSGERSCGCLQAENTSKRMSKDITGKKMGNLTAIKKTDEYSGDCPLWICKCVCGGQRKVTVKDFNKLIFGYCSVSCPEKVLKAFINKKYGAYKRNAMSYGREFTLTLKTFKKLVRKPCYYCGYLHKSNGLDRRNNKKGYIRSNVVPCCKICNQAKHTFKYIDFKKWIKRMVDFQNKKARK